MRTLAALLVLLGLAQGQDEKIYSNSYKGKAPPELAIPKDSWLNAKDALTFEKLKGRVVYLEFGFLK